MNIDLFYGLGHELLSKYFKNRFLPTFPEADPELLLKIRLTKYLFEKEYNLIKENKSLLSKKDQKIILKYIKLKNETH